MGTDQRFIAAGTYGRRGRPAKSNREMLNTMLWIDRTGAQWRALPEYYGPWKSAYSRFAAVGHRNSLPRGALARRYVMFSEKMGLHGAFAVP